jgi:hypothetical protein
MRQTVDDATARLDASVVKEAATMTSFRDVVSANVAILQSQQYANLQNQSAFQAEQVKINQGAMAYGTALQVIEARPELTDPIKMVEALYHSITKDIATNAREQATDISRFIQRLVTVIATCKAITTPSTLNLLLMHTQKAYDMLNAGVSDEQLAVLESHLHQISVRMQSSGVIFKVDPTSATQARTSSAAAYLKESILMLHGQVSRGEFGSTDRYGGAKRTRHST